MKIKDYLSIKPVYRKEFSPFTHQQDGVRFELINSKIYKRVKPLIVIVFFISYFLSWIYVLPWKLILLVVILNILTIVILVIWSKNFIRRGYLSIDSKNIVIAKNESYPFIAPIGELKNLKIIRNSTIHYASQDMYPPETHGNRITFTFNGKTYDQEFCIVNEMENQAFENIVALLRKKYPDFYYASI